MTILAVYNIKGGVGKTATAVNLAYLSAQGGKRTLVWDLDPQGAASFYFRVRAKVKGGAKKLVAGRRELTESIRGTDFEALDLLPADFSYRNMDLFLERARKPTRRLGRLLAPLASRYEYIFIDCTPGYSLVTESVFEAADALVVPTVPTTLSLLTLDRIRKRLGKMERRRPSLFPFLCMVDRRRTLHREVRDRVLASSGFLRTQVPYASAVEKMGLRRAPLATYAGGSEAALAYATLWNEIQDLLRPASEGRQQAEEDTDATTADILTKASEGRRQAEEDTDATTADILTKAVEETSANGG
jgi:cellulose biosynthesis protein BcsQ